MFIVIHIYIEILYNFLLLKLKLIKIIVNLFLKLFFENFSEII